MKKTFRTIAYSLVAVMCSLQMPLVYAQTDTSFDVQRKAEYVPASASDIAKGICSYRIEYEFAGIAVTCSDVEVLMQSASEAHPLTWSDGYWSKYYYLDHEEDSFLIQPIEGFAAEFGQYLKYEGVVYSGQEDDICTLADEFSQYTEPVYLLSCRAGSEDDLLQFTNRADQISVIGLAYGATYSDVFYDTQDDEMCSSYYFIKYKDGSFAFGESLKGMLLEDALVTCDKMADEDESIAYVCITGYTLDTMLNLHSQIELVSFETSIGDVDGNGSIQPVDAMLALKGAAAILSDLQPELTEAQIALADVDKDGDLTVLDAHYILRYYSDQTSGLDVSWEKLTGVSG